MQKILIFVVIIAGALILLLSIPSWLPFGKETSVEVTDKINTIDFELSGISTTIIPENRSNLEAILDGKGSVDVKKEGDRIIVEYQRKWYEQFGFFNNTKLTVYLPEDYDRGMEIEVGSGNVQFNGKSNMSINRLKMEVGSGNINIDSLQARKGEMDISSGNIDLINYIGGLKADVSSGNLNVNMKELNDSVALDVSSGNVNLDLPEDAHFTVDGKVSSGEISNEFDLKEKQESDDHLFGIYGSGKHKLDLNISSGRIEIK